MQIKFTVHKKNYMSIRVSVRTTKIATRNNSGVAQQERSPQSLTAATLKPLCVSPYTFQNG
jgi:hypothetical protein